MSSSGTLPHVSHGRETDFNAKLAY